eukprot:TRINITY_DN32412_c0_g1_i1.p1 TRINITY_DN32412_c0_g1~~TRINITY_DN32412_c0_g1_i1.p1  ORF type:complete len:456 (-),score=80.64 TRINITY_DN32412_c0_g1_i1:165-1532(-)
MAEEQQMEELPEGWAEFFDDDSGLCYYHSESLNITQWERPQADTSQVALETDDQAVASPGAAKIATMSDAGENDRREALRVMPEEEDEDRGMNEGGSRGSEEQKIEGCETGGGEEGSDAEQVVGAGVISRAASEYGSRRAGYEEQKVGREKDMQGGAVEVGGEARGERKDGDADEEAGVETSSAATRSPRNPRKADEKAGAVDAGTSEIAFLRKQVQDLTQLVGDIPAMRAELAQLRSRCGVGVARRRVAEAAMQKQVETASKQAANAAPTTPCACCSETPCNRRRFGGRPQTAPLGRERIPEDDRYNTKGAIRPYSAGASQRSGGRLTGVPRAASRHRPASATGFVAQAPRKAGERTAVVEITNLPKHMHGEPPENFLPDLLLPPLKHLPEFRQSPGGQPFRRSWSQKKGSVLLEVQDVASGASLVRVADGVHFFGRRLQASLLHRTASEALCA